jgi:glycosyltransferase involved in cell wall biosynthesis
MPHATEDYVELAKTLQLSNNVRFDMRYIPDEEANAYYSAADLVVLPYREIYQSAVLLMAMSHGRAVLGSDLPPIKAVIEHGVTGVLFKAGDVDSLTAALSHAILDIHELELLGRNAANVMRTDYSWDRIGYHTKNVYLAAAGRVGG